ncbi:MAG: redoxin domain-containing protein, partial [Candidatus Omnitrophica bacterium]|nr:redoxin domain-containing protein [Candidatus Omnitrophota bacterium]
MKHSLVLFLSVMFLSTPLWAAGFLDKKVVKLGEAIPDFKLADTTGQEHQLSQHRGRVVMIHFWSATCPFVIRYDDRLKEIAEDYTPDGVVVLGIDSNSNETPRQIKKVAEGRKVNYPILIDPGNQIADQFGAVTTPHVFIVDREGKLVYEGAVDDQGWSEENRVTISYARE